MNRAIRPVLLIAACGMVAAPARAQSCHWTRPATSEIPGSRTGAAMAFDAGRSRVVVFGGQRLNNNPQVFGDTWEWDGAAWTQRATSGPPANADSLMAYDGGRNRIVLFRPYSSVQTWEWDGSAWTVANSGTPSGGGFFTLFYDPLYHTLSMLRTLSSGSQIWDWNGSTWTQRAIGPGLPVSYPQAAAFDSGRNRLVAYMSTTTGPAQTWEFDDVAGTWSLAAAGTPSARSFAVMAYDSVHARTILYGGQQTGSDFYHHARETWEWDGSAWSEVTNAAPGPFGGVAACFDSTHARMVLLGGQTYDFGPNETWEYNAGASNPGVLVSQQPARLFLQPGDTGTFHIAATGSGPLSYQWRRNGQPLTNGGNISGSQTTDLTIGPVTGADTGTIDCLLIDACGPVPSLPGSLTVNIPCYPNCDQSTVPPILNPNDFQCFLNSFAAGCPGQLPESCYINCDHSTTPPYLNANDFQCFLNAFAAGCT